MKKTHVICLIQLVICIWSAQADAQVIIDGAGLRVKGGALSADLNMMGDTVHNTIPGDLWIGQWNGELQYCDSTGVCTSQGIYGNADNKCMAVYRGRLWIGQSNGHLLSCSGGSCIDYGDHGEAIESMAVFDDRLWLGLHYGQLKSCGNGGLCTNHEDKGETINAMTVFSNRLWIGQADGELQSCDGTGTCTSHRAKGDSITAMAVFDNRLWLGRWDGKLNASDSRGRYTSYGDKGESIKAIAVFNNALWISHHGGDVNWCNEEGICSISSFGGSNVESMAVFSGRIWFGHMNGELQSYDGSASLVNYGSQGSRISSMAVFIPTSLGNSLYADNGDVKIKDDLEVGGNIGIGLSNPIHKMHIHENSGSLAYLKFTNTDTGTGSRDGNLVGMDPNQDLRLHTYEENNILFHVNDLQKMRIQNDGNVGIGVSKARYKLEVNGSAAKPGGGAWTNSSDLRLKEIKGDYAKGLSEIVGLRPVNFTYKKDNPLGLPSDTEQVGFIGQEVQELFPEAVDRNEEGFLDFNMHAVNVAVINAIKELYAENQALKKKITELKSMTCHD